MQNHKLTSNKENASELLWPNVNRAWESTSHRVIEVGVNGGRNDQSEARV
jgi:hypothetical protein